MNSDRVMNIEVSGKKFRLQSEDIMKYPKSLLYSYLFDLKQDNMSTDYTFNRPVSSFRAIHALYQTGELHLPPTVCPNAFSLELDFWGFIPQDLENCCYFKLLEAMDTSTITDGFRKKTTDGHDEFTNISKTKTFRKRLWCILENSETTVWSKIYLAIAVIFVLISVMSLSLSTLPGYRQKLTTCELRAFLKQEGYDEEVIEYFDYFMDEYGCHDRPTEQWMLDEYDPDINETDIYDMWLIVKKVTTNNLKDKTARLDVFRYLDFVVIAFFTTEFILRLLTCPSLVQYFCNVLNLLECVILLTSYVEILFEAGNLNHKYDSKGLTVLLYFQILRAFRILRVLQNVSAAKVLSHCLKRTFPDIFVLIVLLLIGINIFACAFFFVEDVESIPTAWWWALVSMTTVGYGDIYPKSVGGKLIGSVCILTGVLLLSLVIPVFVSSFVALYQYVQLTQKFEHPSNYEKKKSTQRTQIKVSSISPIKVSS